jgi:hypothetical protein
VINIAQTARRQPPQNVAMAKAALCWWKADRCARMAKDASEPHCRAYYKAQEKAWLNIAVQLEVNESRVDQARSAAVLRSRRPFFFSGLARIFSGLPSVSRVRSSADNA